jgi:hypothetical protein
MREVKRLLTLLLTLGLPLAGFVPAAVGLISAAFTVVVSSIA